MAKGKGFGGFGGGMNMQAMMKQAQKMQQDMQRMQAELEEKEYSAQAGGGVVEAVVTGKRVLKSLTVDPEAVDPEDVEMLQDLVISAVNEALRNVEAKTAEEMDKVTGGLNIPGLV